MALTFHEVAEILKLVDASDCEELILEVEGTKLVVRRAANGAMTRDDAALPIASAPSVAPSSSPAATPTSPIPAPVAGRSAMPSAPGLIEVRAPMVGTFYRRPSPQEAVFVEIGQTVQKGQPLCLIEVMKLFTTIEAEVAGTVEAIVPDDGALVEFDQLLFRIKPS